MSPRSLIVPHCESWPPVFIVCPDLYAYLYLSIHMTTLARWRWGFWSSRKSERKIIINSKCGTYNASWVMKWRGQADIVGHKIGDTRQKNFAAQEYEALNLFKKEKYAKKALLWANSPLTFGYFMHIYSSRTSLIIYPIFFWQISFWFNLSRQI